MKPKMMRKMQTVGHYRRATAGKGAYNKPKLGRVGKLQPSMKKLGTKVRRGR